MRGVYHNSSNINKVKVDDNITIWFREDSSPTIYYNVTKEEITVINQFLKNEYTTDS